MSLVRLLTAGKSLVGIQDSKSRYRSVDPRAMPKFGSEKKADVARESEAKPSVQRASVESPKAKLKAVADRNISGARVEKTPVAAAREARGGWVNQWGSKLSSLVSPKPKPTRSAIPRFNGVPVQGELSLDNIKVVRNDLSDTDLEVVARKVAVANEVNVGRASAKAAEGSDFEGSSAGEDARPTLSTMLSAVNP